MENAILVSVVIPTCDRNDQLALCLGRIANAIERALHYDVEVIVTDDGKHENAKKLLSDRFPKFLWTPGPRRGPAANRNHGAKLASGEWIVFLDDDCVPQEDWLETICHTAAVTSVDVIEGKTISSSEADTPLSYYVENVNGGNFWSCNLGVRRTTFESLGGFDEQFLQPGGEDMEFAHRIRHQRTQTIFLETAAVVHPVRILTLRTLLWRTLLLKWKILYDIKTGFSPPLNAPTLRVVTTRAKNEALHLLRTCKRGVLSVTSPRASSCIFTACWSALTFPMLLPYLLYWDLEFRRRLLQDKSSEHSSKADRFCL